MKKIFEIFTIVIDVSLCLIYFVSCIPSFETTQHLYQNVGLMSILTLSIIAFLLIFKIRRKNDINMIMTLPLILLGGILINGFFGERDWKTDKVLFRHGHIENKTIEIQIQEEDGVECNRRIVERTNYFDIVQKVHTVNPNEIEFPWLPDTKN